MTARNPGTIAGEVGGFGLLWVLGGGYVVLISGWSPSLPATAIGLGLGAGIVALETRIPELNRWQRYGLFIASLGLVMGSDRFIEVYVGWWIAPHVASAAIGIGIAGVVAGIGFWRRREQ